MIALGAVGVLALVWTSADARYRCAERLFQKGEFENASILCERALLCNPRHAATRALYTELQFILGKGKATPSSGAYDGFMQGGLTALTDVDQALQRAQERRAAGDAEAGMIEVRKALEFMKWMPSGTS
jgi:hypothetical protein